MPDDVATPKRMTDAQRAEIETWSDSLSPYTRDALSCCRHAEELLSELRAVEGERDEIREHLNSMYESAIRELRAVEAERNSLRIELEAAEAEVDRTLRLMETEVTNVRAQLAEARRALEAVIVSESTRNKRHTPAMIARLALAKLAPDRSG